MENVSVVIQCQSRHWVRVEGGGRHTIKHRISNKSTRINRLPVNRPQRFTITIVQIVRTLRIPLQLVRIQALRVPPVVLVEVTELVIQEHWRLEVRWDVELDKTLELVRLVEAFSICVVDIGERRRFVRGLGVRGAEVVGVVGDTGEGG